MKNKYEQVAIIFDKRELVDIICAIGALFEKLDEIPNSEYEAERLRMIMHKINQYFKS